MMSEFFLFMISQTPTLILKTWEHIYISGFTLILAISLALPFGILIHRYPKLKGPTLAFANIFQTIPSLAMLALLIPILGIGLKPTLVVLTLYAVLPIIRNTYTGLQNVSPAMTETADGLGFTQAQRLWIIELPLAMPIIIAGIRVAASMTIGIVTIAAFIGAGGLGDFITQGLALNDQKLILLGALPAALLALGSDQVIARMENNNSRTRYLLGVIIVMIGLGLVSFWQNRIAQTENNITIATKNFTEQLILGEILAQFISDNTNLTVRRQFNLGTTEIVHQAMLKGDVDLYVEYSGTAYLTVLNETKKLEEQALLHFVKEAYKNNFNFIWLEPLGFSNSQSLAIREDFAQQNNIKKISDLKNFQGALKISAPPEFIRRPDAYPGLIKAYHLHFAKVSQMDPILMYEAIKHKETDVIAAFTTDGRLVGNNLRVLEDDKNFYPSYLASPVIRQQTLEKHPELFQILQQLKNILPATSMQHLNAEVDVKGRTIQEVATKFLKENKLQK
ncbi:glycine betaine ABC transporter substrate-binding protein [Candidatus Nucleicultrix amoebiphila]|jgi:osmoprotectant transport system permease protein|uniref:ABC transmembrane type-1 domain-containing protein n=1 Tax=Candidatus Nucleicultrix amoebiphila FS5 TaxID=1414854 RepID=A0A1W6N4M1_9PROT|nr:glycine betaine ABC transporter substrate-binding protein [Candidatus Nucleicultrix amoebiphila]ARN84731.1 hypothetical protein GQ61_04810 [Candidatus Nucleicultrix amoebiphila FS5]